MLSKLLNLLKLLIVLPGYSFKNSTLKAQIYLHQGKDKIWRMLVNFKLV